MHLLFHLLSRLPLPVLHAFGVVGGYVVLVASATYRRNLRANLGLALGCSAPSSLVRQVATEAGKAVFEAPVMWCADTARVISLAREVDGWEHVERARAAGKGLVFLTPHLGCFEITAQYIATRVPISVLYRVPRQDWLDRLMREGRGRPGMSSWPADLSGVRALMKALRRKEAVGLLPDQAPKAGEGVWVPFFGRPAYTMTLAGRLAEGAVELVFVWGERLPRGRGYRIHFSVPGMPLPDGSTARAAAINKEVEALIRRCPTQYLWGYNRYKRPAGADEPPHWQPDGQTR